MPREPLQALLRQTIHDYQVLNSDTCMNKSLFQGKVSAGVQAISRITRLRPALIRAWLAYALMQKERNRPVKHPLLFHAELRASRLVRSA